MVEESGQALDGIVGSVKKVTDIVSEIAAASQEQTAGIDQINKAVTRIDEMTQRNAALVEEAAAASQAVGQQARQLDALVDYFKVGEANSSVPHEPERPWRQPRAAASGGAGGGEAWEEF